MTLPPLRWRVTLPDGADVHVETRDRPPFENANGGITRDLGAVATITSCGTMNPDVREQACSHHIPYVYVREAHHRAAVAYLASANGWRGTRIEREE